ncbi:MAG: hypothetical protein GQ574_14270 [Crocinitomix sp.]|nr:hypothetical protein [Crocinitomix sp.]
MTIKFLIPLIGIIFGQTIFAQSFPKVIENLEPATAYLSPNTTLNAWYRIYAVDSVQNPICPSDENKPLYLSDLSGDFYGNQSLTKLVQQKFDSSIVDKPSSFQLFIDTTQNLSIKKRWMWGRFQYNGKILFEKPENERSVSDTLVNNVHAYPVFITNLNSEDSLLLSAQDGSAYITCEAKNENGEWQAIEQWRNSSCGNSYHYYLVPPMHTAFTKMVVFQGEFKTVGRLVIRANRSTIYSNEFNVSVNHSQFLTEDETTD